VAQRAPSLSRTDEPLTTILSLVDDVPACGERSEKDVDFGLLLCEPGLIPFHERLGWRRFLGDLLVTHKQATVPFTFNLPMTIPLRLPQSLGGKLDPLGPPW
jgi:hypothetical protein